MRSEALAATAARVESRWPTRSRDGRPPRWRRRRARVGRLRCCEPGDAALLAQWVRLEAETTRVVGRAGCGARRWRSTPWPLHLRAAARVYAEVEASVAAVLAGVGAGADLAARGGWLTDGGVDAGRRPPCSRRRWCSTATTASGGAADLVAAGEGLDGGRVRVVEVARGDGGSAWVVVVPGTQEWSPRPGANPFDVTTDVRAVTGDATLAAAGVAAALEVARGAGRWRARRRPTRWCSSGHSQGGILAAALASDARLHRGATGSPTS